VLTELFEASAETTLPAASKTKANGKALSDAVTVALAPS
jgi:hypothetical protein